MCGLWGSIGLKPPPDAIASVAHRGPDGAGSWRTDSEAGPVVLMHRRLAIIDPDERANQPFTDASGDVTLVFNGAIYNYIELREELAKAGLRFRTESDTEVLAEAYRAWGEACFSRLNGMFAVIIHDRARRRMVAARDCFGIKPLYVASSGGGVAFASEIKQLVSLPGLGGRVHEPSLIDFLAFGVTDHGQETCFSGIERVPPGHLVSIDLTRLSHEGAHNQFVRHVQWHRLPAPHSVRPAQHAPNVAAELAAHLTRAIRLQLRADVPIGSCLSGGLDSSAIVGEIARGGLGRGQHCVSAVYPGESVDESRYMAAVLERHPEIEQHRVTPAGEDLAAGMDRLIWHQDEPFASTSIFAQWCVFREAQRAGLKVMLDGQGADELFAGYYPMCGAYLAGCLTSLDLLTLAREMAALRHDHGPSLAVQLKWLAAAMLPSAVGERLRSVLLGTGMWRWLRDPPGFYIVPLNGASLGRSGDRLSDLSRRLLLSTSLPMLLRFEDRNSMAHGIEARVPYLDHELVQFALSIDSTLKIRGGELKWIARRAFEPILPREIIARRDKIGFGTPEARWIRGPLRALVLDGVRQAADRFPRLFAVDRLLREAQAVLSGQQSYDGSLWRVACAGLWARRFGMSL